MKKKLGIIGGMGSQAGVWLLQRVTELTEAANDQDYLEILLHSNSQIPDRTSAILYNGFSPVGELTRSVKLLNDCGVDTIVMACMTAYYFYDEIVKTSRAEIIHPLNVVRDNLTSNLNFANKKVIGLIGSSGLVKSRIFHDFLEPLGYEVVALNDQEQQKYFTNPIYRSAKLGLCDESVQDTFMYQFDILKSLGAEIIVGACSEVPLMIKNFKVPGDFINLFEVLAQHVVDQCYYREYAT
ncbi:aspartate racemase [soil metagenome]|jgi:aspartate racemase